MIADIEGIHVNTFLLCLLLTPSKEHCDVI